MRFSMINKKQGLCLCLTILLAMSVLLCAAVPVRAEEDEVVATADMPETEAFEAAKGALLAVIDQDTDDFQTIEELSPEEPYLRKDFVAAMEKCAGAVSLVRNLDVQLEQLEEKLQNSALPEELRNSYWDTLAGEKEELVFDPVTELMEALKDVKAGSSETVFLYKTAAFRMETEALAQKICHLWETLDNYEYLNHTFDNDTGSLAARKEADVVSRLESLTERKDQLKNEVENFFSLSADDQASLPDRIWQLEEDTSAFLLSVKLLSNEKQVNAKVEAMNGSITKATVLAVIGIGAAVAAIVIAIVATVCAARAASKEPEIDLSGTASRDDLRSLKDTLNRELNQVDQKAQQYQAKRMGELEARLKHLENHASSRNESGARIVPPVPVPPMDAPRFERKQIGSLKLEYQNLAPENSCLVLDATGSLILYEDLTVGLKPGSQNLANDMKSWLNQGLLFVFQPQIEGREYTVVQDNLPAGYYVIDQVERPARVSPMGNSYKLTSKGCVKMRKV